MSDNEMCPACGGTVGVISPNRWKCCCNGKLYHGTIVNAAPELIGKTALMRDHESDCDLIMLQFDDVNLEYEGKFLASGWHTFHRDSFETDEECR